MNHGCAQCPLDDRSRDIDDLTLENPAGPTPSSIPRAAAAVATGDGVAGAFAHGGVAGSIASPASAGTLTIRAKRRRGMIDKWTMNPLNASQSTVCGLAWKRYSRQTPLRDVAPALNGPPFEILGPIYLDAGELGLRLLPQSAERPWRELAPHRLAL
jgi:hypothetical protein